MTSAARLSKFEVAALTDEQRALYDAIVGGPRANGAQLFALTDESGRLEGPFNAMLLSPSVGFCLQALGSAVRYRTELTSRIREIAILTVAHSWHCDFEIHAHEAVGRAAGLTDAELESLAAGDPGTLHDADERLAADTAAALVARSDLTAEEYSAALEGLGPSQLFELTTLVGYYATLALQLRVFRVLPSA